jgi:hypothetical protein
MAICKNCKSASAVRNGFVRGKQRFRCKDCGSNFVEGDARTNEKIAAKKAMCVILYSLGKGSFNMLAHIFDTWPSDENSQITESQNFRLLIFISGIPGNTLFLLKVSASSFFRLPACVYSFQ